MGNAWAWCKAEAAQTCWQGDVMVSVAPRISPPPLAAQALKALYVGSFIDEMNNLLSKHVGQIDINYVSRVSEALTEVRSNKFDVVVVDQRSNDLATKLVVPLMSSIGAQSKLIVISSLTDVSAYLAVPGVARVISAPLREAQVLRVLGLKVSKTNAKPGSVEEAKLEEVQVETPRFSFNLVGRAMTMVSNLYKRTAFVLLAALFSAFAFYGLLIAFFLISSSWSAPLTLVRGHELVVKVEAELAQLSINEDLARQRITEAQLAQIDAERTLKEARAIVKSSVGSIESEIRTRQRQIKSASVNIKRLKKMLSTAASFNNAIKGVDAPNKLFARRLIDRKTFEQSSLSSLEASQRSDMLANELETAAMEMDSIAISVEMLKALKANLEGKAVDEPASAPPDLLLLAKQALEARTAISASKSKMESAEKTLAVLENSRKVLARQISELKNSPPGRAIEKRIDVVFVPYTNLQKFAPGTPLYSCALTIVFCSKAGEVGQALPGESTFTHPFFGKPVRGVFVEAELFNPDAAAREIIHAHHAPLYF
jgi:hypothetical protein